ncbi:MULTISPECIES: TRAP transporter small permease subunit [Halomonadaceae]|jgi:TRAP-type mannitol/chloroaromatic compound transport system permease small subunit|uniref:TRAP transporter small permease subunit n=1 Tax=Halomonadaceae TaxID=28256 RepID=UPI001142FBF4|nr:MULTISPECIES: TRAP transporter small permease subunit [Halomonas]UEQ05565.1 TRAP transporter small permease subunit [Halomonas profundus]QNU62299.1 TRAP transporter small permease subunit [Halomonas titanicae]CAD5269039.1 C4-dicarboxylate ABC transporter permease [Halomonas sp. 156]CAD5281742.1 C4-dicarboxylate ABC transporter permease [Halomonas sp. 113]CAD5283080.1 C4-dicarboxylate ABC transporter permease [Halomonas sp. 59]
MRAVAFFVHGVEAVVRLFGWIAAWTCVVLVGLVAGDVLMRYVFSIGAIWLQELQWHLISPIALFGMSYLLLMGEQVRVDVFYERFPVGLQRVIEVIGGLLLLVMGLYIAWLTLPWIAQSFARGEASPNPGGLPLRWLLKSLIPFGFVLLALQGLAHALRQAFALPTRGE